MKILLDEQLDAPNLRVVRSLNPLADEYDCSFESLRVLGQGMQDQAIPGFCATNGFDALVSANFRDFAAKDQLYALLLAAGVSVIAIRPKRRTSLNVDQQASLLSQHLRTMTRLLREAQEPILLSVSETECRPRTLDDLRQEIAGRRQLP